MKKRDEEIEAIREYQRAEFKRLGLSWEHWNCRYCHGHGKIEVHGTGKYDSDNDWAACPEDPPEASWGPALLHPLRVTVIRRTP